MTDIIIVGAGGLGKDVQWMLERINEIEETWNILGYVDDGIKAGSLVDDLPILGTVDYLLQREETLAVVVAVASAKVRRHIIEKLEQNDKLVFPNVADPSTLLSKRIKMGKGNIVLAGNILSVDIQLGDYCIFNADCTIGHDVVMGSYVTVYPSANISGCVEIGQETEIGTGCHIIQGIKVGSSTIVGAGAVVIGELPSCCTAVGNPAKPIKYHSGD